MQKKKGQKIVLLASFVIILIASLFHAKIGWMLLVENIIVRTLAFSVLLNIVVYTMPLLRKPGCRTWKKGVFAAAQFPLLLMMIIMVR